MTHSLILNSAELRPRKEYVGCSPPARPLPALDGQERRSSHGFLCFDRCGKGIDIAILPANLPIERDEDCHLDRFCLYTRILAGQRTGQRFQLQPNRWLMVVGGFFDGSVYQPPGFLLCSGWPVSISKLKGEISGLPRS